MKESIATNLLEYLISHDQKKHDTDNIFNQWASDQEQTLSMADYLEAKAMIRSYSQRYVPIQAMKLALPYVKC